MRHLDASTYMYTKELYHEEFRDILSKMALCYKMMSKEVLDLERDENKIRNTLYSKYLNDNSKRREVGLTSYQFEREAMEDHSVGRTDIKITTANSFLDTSEYYSCECKLLDAKNKIGTSGLNAKYIANGICRFTSGYYHTSSFNINGMIGFVVENIDIDDNVCCINSLMNQSLKNTNNDDAFPNIISPITKTTFIPNFEYQYASEHSVGQDRNITIYHLMMDFSNNIYNDSNKVLN